MNIIIHQDWDRLLADLQQPYIERVRQAREVRNQKAAQEKMYPARVAQNEEIDTNSNSSSLWGIGNRDGVVSIDILRDFCSSFSHKSVVKAAAEIEASADPSTLGGCHIPDKDVDYSITQVRSWRSKNMHCAFFHPGLCKTAHQEVFDDVHSLFLQFQKMLRPSLTGAGATLLRFKAGTNAEHNCIVMYYWLCFRLGNPRRQVLVACDAPNAVRPNGVEQLPTDVSIRCNDNGHLEYQHAHGVFLELLLLSKSHWVASTMEYTDRTLQTVTGHRTTTSDMMCFVVVFEFICFTCVISSNWKCLLFYSQCKIVADCHVWGLRAGL